jgi:hypothetical protein
MTKNLTWLAAGMIALLAASSAALAVGTASRTFVSGVGSDTGSCPLATPCRTFAYALTQTAPSGEIIVLSSAGYGAVTITQAVSIINTSNFAGVTVASGNGITINAGPSDIVVLRGITVDGVGTGTNGILLNSGGVLSMVNCIVQNFTNQGVLVAPTSGTTKVDISNTIASGNTSSGIFFNPTGSATVKGTISQATTNNNLSVGIFLLGAATATVVDSIASNNFYGFATNSGGVMRLGRSVASANNTGVLVGTTVYSYGDNKIDGNTTDVSGSLTSLPSR